jgi:hypothetical protein
MGPGVRIICSRCFTFISRFEISKFVLHETQAIKSPQDSDALLQRT